MFVQCYFYYVADSDVDARAVADETTDTEYLPEGYYSRLICPKDNFEHLSTNDKSVVERADKHSAAMIQSI